MPVDPPNRLAGIIGAANQIATSGRWDTLNNAIERLAKNYAGREDVWYLQTLSGLTALIFTEYNLLKKANQNQPRDTLSLVAWRARNLLDRLYAIGVAPVMRIAANIADLPGLLRKKVD